MQLKKAILNLKIMINRTSSYIAILNAGMILFITLSTLKDAGIINIDLSKYLIPIYLLGFLVLIIVGYIDMFVLRAYKEELELQVKHNPVIMDMKNKIDMIAQKMEIKT